MTNARQPGRRRRRRRRAPPHGGPFHARRPAHTAAAALPTGEVQPSAGNRQALFAAKPYGVFHQSRARARTPPTLRRKYQRQPSGRSNPPRRRRAPDAPRTWTGRQSRQHLHARSPDVPAARRRTRCASVSPAERRCVSPHSPENTNREPRHGDFNILITSRFTISGVCSTYMSATAFSVYCLLQPMWPHYFLLLFLFPSI